MNISPVTFLDRNTGDEGVVLVRVIDDVVGLTLSLKRNGDMEVFFGAEELDRVVDALQAARRDVRASKDS
jgi:hypothetical protein